MQEGAVSFGEWWKKDKMTNGQTLVFWLLGIVLPLVLTGLDLGDVVRLLPAWVWLTVAGVSAVFLAGIYVGRRGAREGVKADTQDRVRRNQHLMRETTELLIEEHERKIEAIREEERELREQNDQTSEKYSVHVQDALGNLERALSGEIEEVNVADFVSEGLFEPAQALLASDARGEIRFSLLKPEGDDLVMETARGHDLESRRKFKLPITGSFAGLALQSGETKASGDLENDERFTPHPQARAGREYQSIVCVPLKSKGETIAVLVAIATEEEAFSVNDRRYIETLGRIHDVAWGIVVAREEESREAS